MCFFSWITAFYRELHQLSDLMDLTLTQGLRQSRRKILKRFDSVGHLISAAKYGGPVDFIEGGTQDVSKGPEYQGDLRVDFLFLSFFLTPCVFISKMLKQMRKKRNYSRLHSCCLYNLFFFSFLSFITFLFVF